jgi:hypothetical protein
MKIDPGIDWCPMIWWILPLHTCNPTSGDMAMCLHHLLLSQGVLNGDFCRDEWSLSALSVGPLAFTVTPLSPSLTVTAGWWQVMVNILSVTVLFREWRGSVGHRFYIILIDNNKRTIIYNSLLISSQQNIIICYQLIIYIYHLIITRKYKLSIIRY